MLIVTLSCAAASDPKVKLSALMRLTDLFCHRASLLQRRLRHHNDEFLTAVARHNIHGPRAALQHLGKPHQDLIAGRMTIGVVVAFEMIDIREQDAEFGLIAAFAENFVSQAFLEKTVRVQARQVVADRAFLKARQKLQVFQRQRRQHRERFQNAQVSDGKQLRAQTHSSA